MAGPQEKAGKPPLDRVLQLSLGGASAEFLEQPCTQESRSLLMHVCKNTSLSPQYLGRSLNLSESEIHGILHAHPNDLIEQKYQVLLKWINKTGHEATYLWLIMALYNNDDLPTTETACRLIAPEKNSRDAPAHPSSLALQASSRPGSLNPTPIDRYRADLAFFFRSTPLQDHGGPSDVLTGYSSIPRQVYDLSTPHTRPAGAMGHVLGESTYTARTPLCSLLEKDGSRCLPGRSPSGESESLASESGSSLCGECVTPEKLHEPRCKHPIGHQLQHKLEGLLGTHCAKVAELQADMKHLQIQVEYEHTEAEMRKQHLVRVAGDSTELHRENEVLRSELAISKETVKLIWDALEKCKVQTNLAPVQEQYRELESDCAHADTPDGMESLRSLKSELESLQLEKDTLDTQLGSLASVHQETLQQLETFKVVKGSEAEHLHKQVDNSRKEMKSLMTQVEKLKHEKEDLESRYRDLQEKSKRQQNKIQFLQSENERLRQNRSEASSVTSVHHPYHPSEILRSISEPGAYDRRHGREISKKSISQDEDASTRKSDTSTSDTNPSQGTNTSTIPKEKVSKCCQSWIQNISEMVFHYETQSHKLSSDAQSLSDKLKQYSKRCRKKT